MNGCQRKILAQKAVKSSLAEFCALGLPLGKLELSELSKVNTIQLGMANQLYVNLPTGR